MKKSSNSCKAAVKHLKKDNKEMKAETKEHNKLIRKIKPKRKK